MLDYIRNARYCYRLILQSTSPHSYNYVGFYVAAVWVSSLCRDAERAQLLRSSHQTHRSQRGHSFPGHRRVPAACALSCHIRSERRICSENIQECQLYQLEI